MSQRFLLTFAAGLLAAGPAIAQERERPAPPVTKFAVAPAAAPVPALRYTLLPELRDSTPGNAALLYYRAFAPDWTSITQKPETNQALEEALTKPLADLKGERGSGSLAWVRSAQFLREVDRAARRQYCDWDMVGRIREEGINMLLADFQSLRSFARSLAVRARFELADGEFDKAVYTLQTNLALGRHAADAPTLIQALVGTAIANVALAQVEEFIRTPGSPNLYWALTALPRPFVDLRKPYQGERMLMDSLLPGFREALRDPNAPPLSPSQVEELASKIGQLSGEVKTTPKTLLFALAMKKYTPAKEFLRGQGRTAEQIAAMPVLQAVLLYEVAEYDRLFDEYQKWQGQSFEIQRKGYAEAENTLKKMIGDIGVPALSLAGLLLPAVHKVSEATARLDRRIAALRCVEAIRLHAAAHGGRLPETLAAITAVPLPDDLVTGRPFQYAVVGGTATLTAPPPQGEPAHANNSFQYEITIVR